MSRQPSFGETAGAILQFLFGIALTGAMIYGIVKGIHWNNERNRNAEIERINRTPEEWPEYKALRLALAANMQVKPLTAQCGGGFSRRTLTSRIIIVPFNRDVIAAAERYRIRYAGQFGGRRDDSNRERVAKLAEGDTSVFALSILNDNFDEVQASVRFASEFGNSLWLRGEHGDTVKPVRYTRIFDESLSPGMNSGLFYLPNPEMRSDGSYTLHVRNFVIDPCRSTAEPRTATFVYTNPDLDFLKLVNNGVTEETLHTVPGVPSGGPDWMTSLGGWAKVVAFLNSVLALLRTIGLV